MSNPFLYPVLITFLPYVWAQDLDLCTHGEQSLAPKTQRSSALVFFLSEKNDREKKERKIRKKEGQKRGRKEGEEEMESRREGWRKGRKKEGGRRRPTKLQVHRIGLSETGLGEG